MEERATDSAPQAIINWIAAPYKYFGEKFGDPTSSLLDAACGNRIQNKHLLKFLSVFGMDMLDLPNDKTYLKHDLGTKFPFEDNAFEYAFSFETIEHLPEDKHVDFVHELLRVARKAVVIGTVSTDGPNYIDKDLVFKASLNCNPFHIKEYSSWDFKTFFDQFNPSQYYGANYNGKDVTIEPNLHPSLCLSNYVLIRKIND